MKRSRRRRLQLGLEESIADLGSSFNMTTQETLQKVGREPGSASREDESKVTWQEMQRRGCTRAQYMSYWASCILVILYPSLDRGCGVC